MRHSSRARRRVARPVPTARRSAFGSRSTDPVAEPLLHGEEGCIDFGPAGSSYYYSRPRMAATGTIEVGGEVLEVEGSAWFDHQWGDFISVGRWLGLVRGQPRRRHGPDRLGDPRSRGQRGPGVRHDSRRSRRPHVAAGKRVRRGRRGRGRHRTPGSPGRPAGGSRCPLRTFRSTLRPTLADQELDTTGTTGVVYWEGSQVVSATRGDEVLGGEGYVELTGYAPTEDAG